MSHRLRGVHFRSNERPPHPEPHTLEVTGDLASVQLPFVNVYLFGERPADDRKWALVDAGLPGWGGRIERAAAARFGPRSRPAAIILTHGHFDHVGSARRLADKWNVPIYAHPLELPYLTGRSSYPPPDPVAGGGLMSLLSFIYPRGPIDLGHRVRPLPSDGTVPGMAGFRWIATPGHSPGHVSLYREADRTLIVGDAFVTTRQESAVSAFFQPPHVSRPPAYYTPDWNAARRSIETLALLRAHVAATGHGEPMYGERMQAQLDRLIREWDRFGLPPRGRYVRRAARADQQGVVYLPPPAPEATLLAVAGTAGVGIALVGATLLVNRWARWRRSKSVRNVTQFRRASAQNHAVS